MVGSVNGWRAFAKMCKNEDFIPVNEPLLNGNEEKYLVECIRTGWISSEGEFVTRFEDGFSSKVGRKYGVAVSNGSVALDVAVALAGISAGDEVIMPTFTIISCVAAVVRAGAVPVFVDCDRDTWNMTADGVQAQITSRTRAIMVVHIYGLPVDMDPVIALAQKHGLEVIEDAAEMHGQTYKSRPCGSFGTISTFSFYPNKHVTTGEGGMVVMDDAKLYERARSLRNLCFGKSRRFMHEELGWNFRMTNMQAAVGLAQLERLDEFVARKRRMGTRYTALLEGSEELQLPLARTEYADNIYWVYGVVVSDAYEYSAQEIMTELGKHGIGTRPFFWPMHKQPIVQKLGFGQNMSCPVAERIAEKGFYVPSGMAIEQHQIDRVAETLKGIFQ